MSPADDRADDIIEFPEADETPKKRRAGLITAISLAAVLIAGAGAAVWTLDDWWPVGEDMEIPLIKANNGPIKVRPDDPGGMTVPNQDKLVYDKLGNPSAQAGVERLLPVPETPMPRPAAPVPLTPPAPGPDRAAPNAVAPPPAPSASAPAAGKPSAPSNRTPTPAEVAAVTPPTPPPPPPEPATATPIEKAPVNGAGGYRVQLLAVRSVEDAQREWDRLKRRNPELLSKLERSITKADLGPAKGVFYRLRAGPLADEEAARKLCAELAKRKVGCLIVRPGN